MNENDIEIVSGDVITIEDVRGCYYPFILVVETAVNYAKGYIDGRSSEWQIEGRDSDGFHYWKQWSDGGHIIKLNNQVITH